MNLAKPNSRTRGTIDSSRLERFYELSSDAFCQLDLDGRFVWASEPCRRMLAPTSCRAEVSERRADGPHDEGLATGRGELAADFDPVGRLLVDLVVPADRGRISAALARARRGEGVAEVEIRMIALDSSPLDDETFLACRCRRVGEGLDCVLRDVSAERRDLEALEASQVELRQHVAERSRELERTGVALRESEALFRALSQELPDALLLLDQESVPLGQIVHANPAACHQHLYSLDELTEMTIFDLDDEQTAESNRRERLALIQQGLTVTFEGQHRRKDGTVFPVEVVAREIVYQGRRLVLAIERDLSERRAEEEERRRLETQVRQAQKLETLGALAGGIAHDFNNLLVGILGNAGLALDELPSGSELETYLQGIEVAAERAADLCRQMLAYSGKGLFVLRSIRLHEMVREMHPLLLASVSRKAELKLEVAPVPEVRADVDQMRQLLLNLVANASDALGDDAGRIVVRLGHARLTSPQLGTGVLDEDLPAGRYILLKVTDTGVGMDSEIRERLFDPFFSTKFTGRGLGLAAVLGIVRGHRGAIRVHSEPGHGTTLEVMLPAAEGGVEAMGEEIIAADSAVEILVVDDEPSVRRVAERTLERAGYRVLLAAGGQEAIDLFSADPEAVAAVVLDLSMPAPDGKETFYALRQLRPSVPVIMSSGFSSAETSSLFPGDRPAAFLQKPYRPRQLLGLLEELAGGPPGGQGRAADGAKVEAR